MSDSDADAGDGGDSGESNFDKEAEREKLREKFARDDEKRESTRRMSELLLKGATMTNRHCDVCGDPLFRQNGQEFCATCRAEGREGGARAGADGEAAAPGAGGRPAEGVDAESPGRGGESTDVTSGEPASAESTADEALDGLPGDDPAGRSAGDEPTARRHATGQRRAPPSQSGSTGDRSAARGSNDDAASRSPPTPGTDRSGDVGEAREALVAALTRHATAGADQADPRAARDHLAAAREAAEALAALRR